MVRRFLPVCTVCRQPVQPASTRTGWRHQNRRLDRDHPAVAVLD